MESSFFQIAGFNFKIRNFYMKNTAWEKFENKISSVSDCKYCVTIKNYNNTFYHGLEVYPEFIQNGILIRNQEDFMIVNREWTKGDVFPLRVPENVFSFIVVMFDTHAVQRRMIHLHCATIADRGRGILFLGPSGIGKTTQAERWRDYRGSLIINGDMGYVQETKDGFTAWGTPWHGSSPYCENTSVPLKAMVVLKQAPYNKLRELSGFEKVQEISGNVLYPQWMEGGMELCLSTLDSLLTTIPVYRLDNRADEEGVRLLAEELDHIAPSLSDCP